MKQAWLHHKKKEQPSYNKSPINPYSPKQLIIRWFSSQAFDSASQAFDSASQENCLGE